jgi:magnesium-transporting ATPase (P-type)
MEFVTVYFLLTVISAFISLILLILAGVDHGTSSFYLMLIVPTITIIHHIFIMFFPTYKADIFSKEYKGSTRTLPTHAMKSYLAMLCLLSVLWTFATMITFYAVGMNVARKKPHANVHTGGAECAFGLFEIAVSWTMFALCIKERATLSYQGVPLHENA